MTRPLRATGEAYQGINVLLLWMEAVAAGHPSPTWMIYRQAQAFGGQVRKGECGCPVVYFGTATKRGEEESAPEPAGDDAGREVRFLKTYTVFNLAQIDGLPERFAPDQVQAPPLPAPERICAELGSAYLAADLGLYLEPREDHAAYLASWIKVLQGDKRAIVSAAAHAERAVKFLHGLQPLQEAAP